MNNDTQQAHADSIPDAAIEAAAKVMYAQDSKWEDLGEFSIEVYEHDAREVLEAAAPHIIRAWINDTSRLPKNPPSYGEGGRVNG